jgi:hypothetical protein
MDTPGGLLTAWSEACLLNQQFSLRSQRDSELLS